MDIIEQILLESKANKWPYPKTFEALKTAGVESYTVYVINQFKGVYKGTFGIWEELDLPGYRPLQAAPQFSEKGMKAALDYHIQNNTSYLEFIADMAANGSTHYKVDMNQRMIRYYSPDESQFHEEKVPEWEG